MVCVCVCANEQNVTHHMYKLHADSFCEQPASVVKSGNQLVKTCPLYFLTLDVGEWIIEVEQYAALLQLPYHKTGLITCSRV